MMVVGMYNGGSLLKTWRPVVKETKHILDENGVLARAVLRETPAMQCAACGGVVPFSNPQVFRLGGRLYVGAVCPQCGSFVGNAFSTELRPVRFFTPEEAEQEGIDVGALGEPSFFADVTGKQKPMYALQRVGRARDDFVAFLSSRCVGLVWKDGEFTDLWDGNGIKKPDLGKAIPAWGWNVDA